jgi:hypothetical protein
MSCLASGLLTASTKALAGMGEAGWLARHTYALPSLHTV